MSSPLLVGFIASFTLIAAIGAQNAFVLRQGIRHAPPVGIEQDATRVQKYCFKHL